MIYLIKELISHHIYQWENENHEEPKEEIITEDENEIKNEDLLNKSKSEKDDSENSEDSMDDDDNAIDKKGSHFIIKPKLLLINKLRQRRNSSALEIESDDSEKPIFVDANQQISFGSLCSIGRYGNKPS